MEVRCNRRCWDGVKCLRYLPDRMYDIDPLEPIAKYFDLPKGTEIYHKIKGGKDTPSIETTRIVGGEIKLPAKQEKTVTQTEKPKFVCACGFETNSKAGLYAHFRGCDVMKKAAMIVDTEEEENNPEE